MSLTVANLLILMCRVSPTERKELRVGCLMILKEGHGKVAMPDDAEGRTWECRKLASYEETEEVGNKKKCTFVILLCRVHIE